MYYVAHTTQRAAVMWSGGTEGRAHVKSITLNTWNDWNGHLMRNHCSYVSVISSDDSYGRFIAKINSYGRWQDKKDNANLLSTKLSRSELPYTNSFVVRYCVLPIACVASLEMPRIACVVAPDQQARVPDVRGTRYICYIGFISGYRRAIVVQHVMTRMNMPFLKYVTMIVKFPSSISQIIITIVTKYSICAIYEIVHIPSNGHQTWHYVKIDIWLHRIFMPAKRMTTFSELFSISKHYPISNISQHSEWYSSHHQHAYHNRVKCINFGRLKASITATWLYTLPINKGKFATPCKRPR